MHLLSVAKAGFSFIVKPLKNIPIYLGNKVNKVSKIYDTYTIKIAMTINYKYAKAAWNTLTSMTPDNRSAAKNIVSKTNN